MHIFVNVHENEKKFQADYQLCFVNCDWNVFCFNSKYKTNTRKIANSFTQNVFCSKDRRCHDQQHSRTQNYYANMAMSRCCLIVESRSVRDLNINSRMAALKSNGRQVGCYTQIRGWAFLAAQLDEVLGLIVIIVIR